LNLTTPPQLFADGYDAGFALGNVLQANYQFAYEDQWDYNPSSVSAVHRFEYVNTCLNYPSSEPAVFGKRAAGNRIYCAVFAARCPLRIQGRGSSRALVVSIRAGFMGQIRHSCATGTTSVVGQILNIWQPSVTDRAGRWSASEFLRTSDDPCACQQ